MAFPTYGLYAITQTENKTADQVVEDVSAAIRGGVKIIQYRDKNPTDAYAIAQELLKICRRHNIPLLINDDIELAINIKADGVHLGKDDSDLKIARQRLGHSSIIGVSCYNSLDRALTAQVNGATYVAFGRFFPSSSKPLASSADIQTLHKAKQAITLPIVAIGGIMPENGGQLLEAGADLLAVIGGIFDRNPEQSARAFQSLFKN
ncbi:thiamine-phosphate pyrophosphorylase [biofilm metagenome]